MMQIWLKYENYNAKFMHAFYMHQHPQAYPILVLEYEGDEINLDFAF